MAILAAVVEERFAIAFADAFHFADKNSVVAGHILRCDIAGELSECSGKHRNAGGRPFKLHVQLTFFFGWRMRLGEMLRESLLVTAEDVHTETALQL